MRTRARLMVFLLIMPLITIAIQGHRVNATEPALLKVVNPLTGDQSFNFSSKDKRVGDTFIVNVTVADVAKMVIWQFALQWNSSIIGYVNATIPSDNVFAYCNARLAGPALEPSNMLHLGEEAAWEGNVGFNGSGVLAQVEFKILKKEGQCDLSFEEIPLSTLLLSSDGEDISFVPVSGHYSLTDQTLFGDVNFDEKVDVRDVYAVILAFNSFPNTPRWNAFSDLDGNGHVDMRDAVIVVLNFGKHA